jgi:hypothetical protein
LLHVPCDAEQVPPFATHDLVLKSQQPPLLQMSPAQHGCPAPPHVAHCPFDGLHARPDAVQKLEALP